MCMPRNRPDLAGGDAADADTTTFADHGFARGDKVHAEEWGDLVFTVEGWLAGPGISRLVEIVSLGGIAGAVPADQLRRVREL